MKFVVVGFSMFPNDSHKISVIDSKCGQTTEYLFRSDMDYEDIAYVAYMLYNELNYSTDELVLITSKDLEGLYELTELMREFENGNSERGNTN